MYGPTGRIDGLRRVDRQVDPDIVLSDIDPSNVVADQPSTKRKYFYK